MCRSKSPVTACGLGSLTAGIIAFGTATPPTHAASCMYEIVAMLQGPPCPPFGTPTAFPKSINDRNEVVGYYRVCGFGSDRAFHWSQATGLQTIAMPPDVVQGRAYDINNYGVITGTMGGLISPYMGFVYDHGVFIFVGLLPGGNYSEALAINGDQIVAGYTGNSVTSQPAASEAYIWSAGLMTGLNPVLEVPHSSALDINSDSRITGWLRHAVGQERIAFVTDGTFVTELGPVPGGIASEGWAINRWGDVAGMGRILDKSGDDLRVPFRYIDGTMEVGTPLPGYDEGFAHGINARGCVVGYSYTDSLGNLAFIWDDDGLQEANPLVCPPRGSVIWELYDINDAGWMIGGGEVDGEVVGIVLRPIFDSTDLNHDGFVDGIDLAILLGSWGLCRCEADLDLDGTVTGVDLAMLLAAWSPI